MPFRCLLVLDAEWPVQPTRILLCQEAAMYPSSQRQLLPPETILSILKYLKCKDLLSCSAVCKYLRSFVTTVPELIYISELAIAGFADSSTSRMLVAERLRLLRDLQSRWRILAPVKRQSIPLVPSRDSLCNQYVDGQFIRMMDSNEDRDSPRAVSAQGHSLPNRVMDDAGPTPVVGDILTTSNLKTTEFCIDPGADLIVFLECIGIDDPEISAAEAEEGVRYSPTRSTIRIHTRSLSSRGTLTHSASKLPVYDFEMGGEEADISIISLRVADDLIGICAEGYGAVLVIWNWKSGEKLVHLDWVLPGFHDFAFLSSNDFILLAADRTPGRRWKAKHTLGVYSFGTDQGGENVSTMAKLQPLVHLLDFCLPDMYGPLSPLSISTGKYWASAAQDLPFSASTDAAARIFVIDLADLDLNPGQNESVDEAYSIVNLVVHGNALLSRVASCAHVSETVRIPWDEWGPENTRLFETAGEPDWRGTLPRRSISGERIVFKVLQRDGSVTAQLLDFNPRIQKRLAGMTTAEHNDCSTENVTGPTTHRIPRLFEHAVTTSLPYSTVRIWDHQPYDDFILDEQRLLCLRTDPMTGRETQIDAMIF